MFCVKVNKGINRMVELFYRLGLWHRGDVATIKEKRIKIFYSIYYLLYPISLGVGAITSENRDESVALVEAALMSAVLSVKLLYIIWRKNEINELLQRICVYSIKYQEDYTRVDNKLKRFANYMNIFVSLIYFAAVCLIIVAPFLGDGKKIFFNIGFPLDYNNNEIAYWIAFAFIFTEGCLSSFGVLFSIMMWYLLLNCGLKYEILGSNIKNIGVIRTIDVADGTPELSEVEKQILYYRNFIEATEFHEDAKSSVNLLDSYLSDIFVVTVVPSGMCICTSIYSIAYYSGGQNIVEYGVYLCLLLYNIFDVFMAMYFSNEMLLSSDRLTYCLFESNWVEQPQSCKMCIIIFTELLKIPHEIVILKIYPLTLETFTRIMNSAYSMFNILKSFT